MTKLKFLIISFIAFTFWAKAMDTNTPIITYNSYNTQYQPTDISRCARFEHIRSQGAHLSNFELQIEVQKAFEAARYNNDVTKQIVTNLSNLSESLNIEPLKPLFALNGFNASVIDKGLQQSVDKVVTILYTPQGQLNLHLDNYEKYQIARVVTDQLKCQQPCEWKNIVKDLAKSFPEFQQVKVQELPSVAWITHRLHKTTDYACGLVKSLFAATHSYENILKLKENILANKFNQDLNALREFCLKGDFFKAKEIVEYYKQHQTDNYGVELSFAMQRAYDMHVTKYAQNLLNENFGLQDPSSISVNLIKETLGCRSSLEAAECFYSQASQHQNDSQFMNEMGRLCDEYGFPLSLTYDREFLKEVSLPRICKEEHVPERVLLFRCLTQDTGKEKYKDNISVAVKYLTDVVANNAAKSRSDTATAILEAVEGKGDQTILKCGNFARFQASGEKQLDVIIKKMEERSFAAVANLTKEIKSLKQIGSPEKRIEDLQQKLVTLDEKFQKFDGSFETQQALTAIIKDIFDDLGVSRRPELHRTDSQKKLFALNHLDLLVTGKTESYAHSKQPLDVAKVYHRALLEELLHNDTIWVVDESLRNAVVNEYLQLSKEASLLNIEKIQLDRDSNFTLLEGVHDVVKDSFEIIVTDFPLKEVGDYAYETLSDPKAYLLKAIEGFAQLGSFLESSVVDYCKSNISFLGASERSAYDFSKRYNEAVHRFAENWKHLDISHKKEFVAKLLVDIAANKALATGAKLTSEIIGDCILSLGEGSFPGNFGGGMAAIDYGALAADKGVAVAAGVSAGGDVAAVPIGIGAAINSGFDSLFDTMARRGDVESFIAEGSPDYLEKCVKLEPLIGQPIEATLDVKTVIHKVPLTSENKLIKEFDIIKNHYDHMFSPDHVDKGIIKLGTNRTDIIEKFTNIVLDLDRQGLLVENGVQIETVINGLNTTIRVRIMNGKVFSFNGFVGHSNNVIGKLIQYRYKGL